jgi:metacaspase-1
MKKALLVGLNHYPDPENNLKGCVNDILQTSKVLQEGYGFDAKSEIRLLTDERATTQAIADRLRWLVKGAAPGDILVFHYSGHGSQVRDREGDELDDGLDEIICPYDLDWDDPFTDDDMHEIVKDVPAGVNLTVILDCCHSGTGLRRLSLERVPLRSRCLVPPPDILHRVRPVIEDHGDNRRLTMTLPAQPLRLRRFGMKAAAEGAVLLAGCKASQTCADAWIDGDYHGAFTHFLWKTAGDSGQAPSYAQLMGGTRRALADAGYEQVPQLEGPGSLLARPAFVAFEPVGVA